MDEDIFMSVRYLVLFVFLSIFSFCCNADDVFCKYPKDYVSTKSSIVLDGVISSNWIVGVNADSGEYVKTLYLVFNNGDVAAVEHKYCEMHNVEINYIRHNNKDVPNISNEIGNKIDALFSSYTNFNGVFRRPLKEILKSALDTKFHTGKQFSIELPNGDVDVNDTVEYSIGYMPYDGIGSSFAYIANFYWGVGGE